jgi:hypothetical protein
VYSTLPLVLFFELFGASAKVVPFCYPDSPHFNNFEFEVQGLNDTMVSYTTMAVSTDISFLCVGLLINVITLVIFWRQRHSGGEEAKKTVEAFTTTLLFISLGDFICHLLWVMTDVGLMY